MKNQGVKITEIEGKNSLRIPKSVLAQLPFPPRGKFLILQGSDFITFKRISTELPRTKFRAVAEEIQKKTKALKIKKSLVTEAIAWARKK